MEKFAIKKNGKYMGCGEKEGTAWFDSVCPEVVKGSFELMRVQMKHISKYTDMDGAEIVAV